MIEKEGYSILIPSMELGGSVKIVILSDPDGHEVRFMKCTLNFASYQSRTKHS